MPHVPKKKSARQLTREIAEVLSRPERTAGANGGAAHNDEAGMARVTKDRVHEPLIGERITRSEPVYVELLAGRPEEWKLVFTRGKNYGGAVGAHPCHSRGDGGSAGGARLFRRVWTTLRAPLLGGSRCAAAGAHPGLV